MKMKEEIYVNEDVAADNRAESSDSDHSYEDIIVNEDHFQSQKDKQSENSGGETTCRRCCRLTAVYLLLLLCVLLLTAITVLWIKYNNLNIENNNLTIERDQIQTRYNTLTVERDQLQTSYNTLTIERDQLQTRYNNLTIERDQLQTRYKNLTIERDQLQRDKAELQMCSKPGLDSGWICFRSSIYYISNEVKTWNESRQDCIRRGVDLLIINNEEEQEFISKRLGRRRAWFGLSEGNTERVWKWVDGSPLNTPYWKTGQPDHPRDEDCAEFYGNPGIKNWNDYLCSSNLMWVCEKSYS